MISRWGTRLAIGSPHDQAREFIWIDVLADMPDRARAQSRDRCLLIVDRDRQDPGLGRDLQQSADQLDDTVERQRRIDDRHGWAVVARELQRLATVAGGEDDRDPTGFTQRGTHHASREAVVIGDQHAQALIATSEKLLARRSLITVRLIDHRSRSSTVPGDRAGADARTRTNTSTLAASTSNGRAREGRTAASRHLRSRHRRCPRPAHRGLGAQPPESLRTIVTSSLLGGGWAFDLSG
jgi:hypothetical protein